MSHLLELLGRGLDSDLGDLLRRYYWAPQSKSLEQLEGSCREHPDRPEVRLQLGLACLRALRLPEAIEHLAVACRRAPDCLAARVALASACVEHGDPARAVEHLKIANQLSPGQTPVLFAIGFCLERLNRPDEAAGYYRDAVARDGSFLPARERLACLAVVANRLDEAIEQYLVLRREHPEDSWVRAALAHLYYRTGQYEQAVEEFECAIAMEPENWALVDDEVEALVADGRVAEAIERLHTLIDRQGPFADLHARLGDLYSRTGDDESALRHYRQALEAQPGYFEAKVKMGTHHLAFGRWEEAAESFSEAAEINERVLVCYVGMGVAQAAAGRRRDAVSSFDLAAAIEPNSMLLLAEIARLQLKSLAADAFNRNLEVPPEPFPAEADAHGEVDELLHRQLERHVEETARHPRHADLRYRYGVLLRAEGRLTEALEEFAEAVRINPAYVRAIIKLGITQQELGRIEEAIETFSKALNIAPQYVDVHYRLGLLYTDRRQFEEAARHMEQAAEGAGGNENVRAGLALALQNMGLMDRSAAIWRSLRNMHTAGIRGGQPNDELRSSNDE